MNTKNPKITLIPKELLRLIADKMDFETLIHFTFSHKDLTFLWNLETYLYIRESRLLGISKDEVKKHLTNIMNYYTYRQSKYYSIHRIICEIELGQYDGNLLNIFEYLDNYKHDPTRNYKKVDEFYRQLELAITHTGMQGSNAVLAKLREFEKFYRKTLSGQVVFSKEDMKIFYSVVQKYSAKILRQNRPPRLIILPNVYINGDVEYQGNYEIRTETFVANYRKLFFQNISSSQKKRLRIKFLLVRMIPNFAI
jgi:hypothetical protein